jgi:hypothetical protein
MKPGTARAAIPRTRRPRRVIPGLLLLAASLSLTACSTTQQKVQPDGDVVVRTGTTTLGWILMFAGVTVAAVILCMFLVVTVGVASGSFKDSLDSKKRLQAVAWILAIPVILGVLGVMAWAIAANTLLKSQSTIATASRERGELRSTQRYLIGDDKIQIWKYGDLKRIEFQYIAANDNTPPQGVVSVRESNHGISQIFSGSACPARSLANALSSATGLPIDVRAGNRDIASYGSFLTQIRCGVKKPFNPSGWRQYPTEAWRVLDLPFLWRWPWALPVVIAEIALVAGFTGIIALYRASRLSKPITVAIGGVIVLAFAAINVFATRSHGSWPAALALFALIAASIAKRSLKSSA